MSHNEQLSARERARAKRLGLHETGARGALNRRLNELAERNEKRAQASELRVSQVAEVVQPGIDADDIEAEQGAYDVQSAQDVQSVHNAPGVSDKQRLIEQSVFDESAASDLQSLQPMRQAHNTHGAKAPQGFQNAQGSLVYSFKYAFDGFVAALDQRNFRIHLAITGFVVVMNLVLRVPIAGWAATLLCAGSVLVLELLNTALESLVDLITQAYHPLAKRVKDIAAAAVLVAAVMSVVVGLLVWVPAFISLFVA